MPAHRDSNNTVNVVSKNTIFCIYFAIPIDMKQTTLCRYSTAEYEFITL